MEIEEIDFSLSLLEVPKVDCKNPENELAISSAFRFTSSSIRSDRRSLGTSVYALESFSTWSERWGLSLAKPTPRRSSRSTRPSEARMKRSVSTERSAERKIGNGGRGEGRKMEGVSDSIK